MSKKLRATIFTTVLILVGVLSLVYSAKALADLIFCPILAGGPGTQVVLKPHQMPVTDTVILETNLQGIRQVVARRLDQLNLSGSYRLAGQADQLAVILPEGERLPYIVNIITHVGEIEFIDGGVESPPLGQQVETSPHANPAQQRYRTLFTGQEIEEIVPPDSTPGQLFYRLVLSPEATQRFGDFARRQPRPYVCMVMDRRVINCSNMYHWADNTLDILPNFSGGTVVSLADLAIFLDSGPLPVPLEVEN
ncbi:MAG: hypothetical protein JXM69_21730 [Anaerolineae bacterium]|nr:hypothetical protein [Anaerolineae bacterium]